MGRFDLDFSEIDKTKYVKYILGSLKKITLIIWFKISKEKPKLT